MRDWEKVQYNDTYKKLVDDINQNVDNSIYNESVLSTVLCNGILYSGNETVNGNLVSSLKPVKVSGIVTSDTILDNFNLFFRETGNSIMLNKFPIDLLSYKDGRPHFLFMKEDLSYRVSDYMFGLVGEILIARFLINKNGSWNHFYVMGSRAGTPLYHAADEWYDVEGIDVTSSGRLELSQTSGTVKRSGIDFSDMGSPDLANFYGLATEKMPIRYINANNEVDYLAQPVYSVEPNKYMTYDSNKKYKVMADDYIRDIQNLYYTFDTFCNTKAEELRLAIGSQADKEDLQKIVDVTLERVDDIYHIIDNLYVLLGNDVLSSVRRAGLRDNKDFINTFITTNLKNIDTFTAQQVSAISTLPYYINLVKASVCEVPLIEVLTEIEFELNKLTFDVGQIHNVPNGKFTVQRILWDVYENCYIIQYGNKLYDTFEDATAATYLLDFPAPYNSLFYLPVAILVIHQGATSINDDNEVLIIERRGRQVDQPFSEYADYVARALANKALLGVESLQDYIDNELQAFIQSIDTRMSDFEGEIDGKINDLINGLLKEPDGTIPQLKGWVTNEINTLKGSAVTYSNMYSRFLVEDSYDTYSYSAISGRPGWNKDISQNKGYTFIDLRNGGTYAKEATFNKAGYFPLAIAGYYGKSYNEYDTEHTDYGIPGGLNLSEIRFTSRSVGKAVIRVEGSGASNNTGWTYHSRIKFQILWVKVG